MKREPNVKDQWLVAGAAVQGQVRGEVRSSTPALRCPRSPVIVRTRRSCKREKGALPSRACRAAGQGRTDAAWQA